MNQDNDILFKIEDLSIFFPIKRGVIKHRVGYVKAVDRVSFNIFNGETLGLVGESGCGKTTLGRAILQLYRPTTGNIIFRDQALTSLKGNRLRRIRRDIQIIFQDPYSSLNPRMTVGRIIGEPLKIHQICNSKELKERVQELLSWVGLNPAFISRYPHEFSGGQRQRIGIARALASQPQFIVCDEPISALDVSIQAQVVNLLEEIQNKLKLTYLFIAHDLSMIRHISDRVAVMYLGKLVELTERHELFTYPLHPYSKALLSAVPIPDPYKERKRERIILKGDVPSPANPPRGCRFHTRCPIAIDICKEIDPDWREYKAHHWVSCHLA